MQTDLYRPLAAIVPPNTAVDGRRYPTPAENYKRTERYQLRVTGTVDVTVAGTAVINRGSILAALGRIGFVNNGEDIVAVDARLAAFISNKFAPSATPATRLGAAAFGIATTTLEEIVPIILSAYGTGNLNETKYVEANKQALLQVFVESRLADIARIVTGPAVVGTIEDVTVNVEQVCDELLNVPPFLQTYIREIEQNVTAVNPRQRLDLRGSRYVRGIAIQQDSDDGEVDDMILTLILRGDKRSVFGDAAIPFEDLRQAQAYESGGELPPGYLFIDFARYGRLSTLWAPYQDTNFRLELGVTPSASTNGIIRVAVIEYDRTDSTTTPVPFTI
jgi:hypothetical protein